MIQLLAASPMARKLLGGGIALLFLLIAGYFLYNRHISLVEDLQEVKNANAYLQSEIETRDLLMDSIKLDIERQQEISQTLMNKQRKYDKQFNTLHKRLTESKSGERRDVGKLSIAKPTLMNKIIQKGSNNRLRCFEILSGSEIIEGEKNNVCKDLVENNIDNNSSD